MDAETARHRMVDRLERAGRIERPATARAMRAVPRHLFLPDYSVTRAYEDRPLRIGANQTVSAPHIVARITDLLGVSPGDRVLEIGTGCGYHAAVTGTLVRGGRTDTSGRTDGSDESDRTDENDGAVVSVEYHERLAEQARERLARLDVPVRVRVGDGHEGWPAGAPYDAAYLTCAAETLPAPVLEQVREGGPVVAPVGRRDQRLVRVRRTDDGLRRETHGRVRFVPMLGGG